MNQNSFAKLCKELQIIDPVFTKDDAHDLFHAVRQRGRHINFEQFRDALAHIGDIKGKK